MQVCVFFSFCEGGCVRVGLNACPGVCIWLCMFLIACVQERLINACGCVFVCVCVPAYVPVFLCVCMCVRFDHIHQTDPPQTDRDLLTFYYAFTENRTLPRILPPVVGLGSAPDVLRQQ